MDRALAQTGTLVVVPWRQDLVAPAGPESLLWDPLRAKAARKVLEEGVGLPERVAQKHHGGIGSSEAGTIRMGQCRSCLQEGLHPSSDWNTMKAEFTFLTMYICGHESPWLQHLPWLETTEEAQRRLRESSPECLLPCRAASMFCMDSKCSFLWLF